jgi:hypothetical protein
MLFADHAAESQRDELLSPADFNARLGLPAADPARDLRTVVVRRPLTGVLKVRAGVSEGTDHHGIAVWPIVPGSIARPHSIFKRKQRQ